MTLSNPQRQENMAELLEAFLLTIRLIQASHQIFSDIIKDIFSDTDTDLTPSQILLLTNINSSVPVSEIQKGGSNVGYNLRKLSDLDYIRYHKCRVGERGRRIALTDKGTAIRARVVAAYDLQMHALTPVSGISLNELRMMNVALGRLTDFWSHQRTYCL